MANVFTIDRTTITGDRRRKIADHSGESPILTGMVISFANTTAPVGFLSCDGSAVSRTTYSDLFTAIGTTWGSGDGSTTFNVPDLRGGFLRGAGSQTYTRTHDGGTVGQKTVDTIKDHGHRFRTENTGPTYATRTVRNRGAFRATNSATPPVNPNEPGQQGSQNLIFFGSLYKAGWIGGWNEWGLRVDRIDTDGNALRDNAAGGNTGNNLTRGGTTFPFNATLLHCIKF